MILNITDIKPFLNENKKVGGILNFVDNNEEVLTGLIDNKKFNQYLLYFVSSPLNHFYYYFLANFEQKLYDALILRKEDMNINQFSTLLHSHLRDRYMKNVYGSERNLWQTNGKSLDRTISCFIKTYDPDYIAYLYEKGYRQLAELAFDIYLYYPVFGGHLEWQNFLKTYKPFLESEWKPISFDNIGPMGQWMYGNRFRTTAEQIHNKVET